MFVVDIAQVFYPKNKMKKKLEVLQEAAPVSSPVVKKQQEIVRKFRAKFNAERKWHDRFADWMTEVFGKIWFFIFHILFFLIWILMNNNLIPGIHQFDPYPHNFLTMVVSLEAIFLSIIVLISQNRQATIADMREEIDFNINIRAEQEITKILNLVDKIHDHLGMENEGDEELKEMKEIIDIDALEKVIEDEYIHKKKKK